MTSTHQSHAPKFCNWFINIPAILSHFFEMIEGEDLLTVSQWKGKFLELFKDRSSRMIFLLVCKSQVSHVFAQNVNAIRVFTSRASTADLFNARDNTQWNIELLNWILLVNWVGFKVKTEVSYGESSSLRSIVRADVRDIVCLFDSLAS